MLCNQSNPLYVPDSDTVGSVVLRCVQGWISVQNILFCMGKINFNTILGVKAAVTFNKFHLVVFLFHGNIISRITVSYLILT